MGADMAMQDTRNFIRYNFVTGAADGSLAYDFSGPVFYPPEEPVYDVPQERIGRRNARIRAGEKTLEDERTASRGGWIWSVLVMLGVAVVVVLLTMMLLKQIDIIRISRASVDLETQIAALEEERDKLAVEYEKAFSLKDVEAYATDVLGMQEPTEEQIHYLTNVSSADKAVIITYEEPGLFSVDVDDLLAPILSYFH